MPVLGAAQRTDQLETLDVSAFVPTRIKHLLTSGFPQFFEANDPSMEEVCVCLIAVLGELAGREMGFRVTEQNRGGEFFAALIWTGVAEDRFEGTGKSREEALFRATLTAMNDHYCARMFC